MMVAAADTMKRELSKLKINKPNIPVISNVTAGAVTKPEKITELLVKQVTSRVRWRESVLFMEQNGVDTVIEIGAGKVLTGLTRRINPDLKSISVQETSDIYEVLEML